MKFITQLKYTLAALSSTIIIGCNPSSDETLETDSTQQQMTRTETSANDSIQNLEAFTYDQKSQFITTVETELNTINRSIDELERSVEMSDADIKVNATARLNELRQQADLLEEHIDDIRDTNASNWDQAKATTHNSYENLKQNFEGARQWMSDKIES